MIWKIGFFNKDFCFFFIFVVYNYNASALTGALLFFSVFVPKPGKSGGAL